MPKFYIIIEAHRKNDHLLYHHFTEVEKKEDIFKIATFDIQKLINENWLIGKLNIEEG